MRVTSHDVNRAQRVVRIGHVEACGWRYCAAARPNNASCTKKTNTPGVLMHVFPRNDLLRRGWTAFVRDTQTRSQADEGKTSELCWDSPRVGLLHQAHFGSSASSFIRICSPGEVDIWRKDRCHYPCWNLLNHVGHPSRMAIEVGAN